MCYKISSDSMAHRNIGCVNSKIEIVVDKKAAKGLCKFSGD